MSTITIGKSGYAVGIKRTVEEWDELARTVFIPHLEADGTMTELRSQYGSSTNIRKALVRVGFQPIGAKRGIQPQKTKGVAKKVLAKRLAARRQSGASWHLLVFETSMAADEIKALLTDHGYGDLAAGRVLVSQRALKQREKAEAMAAAAAAKKVTRKRAVKK